MFKLQTFSFSTRFSVNFGKAKCVHKTDRCKPFSPSFCAHIHLWVVMTFPPPPCILILCAASNVCLHTTRRKRERNTLDTDIDISTRFNCAVQHAPLLTFSPLINCEIHFGKIIASVCSSDGHGSSCTFQPARFPSAHPPHLAPVTRAVYEFLGRTDLALLTHRGFGVVPLLAEQKSPRAQDGCV